MCIYIDNTFYTKERDEELCYKYMFLLAYMLACKSKYFTSVEDYNGYSCYLANSTYSRMADTTKVPIKSVLNYMKSIMRFRRAAYLRETFNQIIDPEYNKNFDSNLYQQREINKIESNNSSTKQLEIYGILEEIPDVIKSYIPKHYHSDKYLSSCIYISSLLTFLDHITLPKVKKEYAESKLKSNPEFKYEEYFLKSHDENIIRWNISPEYDSVICLVINKTKNYIQESIRETIQNYTLKQKDIIDLNYDLKQSRGESSEI